VIQKYTVVPKVPDRLSPLLTIARNLWWVWNRNAVALFRRIDIDLWEECHHNPIQLLGTLHPERIAALADDEAFVAHMEGVAEELEQYLAAPTWYSRAFQDRSELRVAYFSAEFGLHECLPFYGGGLGILAGDHLKSSGELGVPLVGVGLCYQQGYNHQYLTTDGWQQELYPDNDFYNMPMTLLRDDQGKEVTVEVAVLGRRVTARIWKIRSGRTELNLLDTNLSCNHPDDREITARLYGGDLELRIRQEILLGIGGMRALHRIDYWPNVCHMNEGHSAFLGLERIRMLMQSARLTFDEAREGLAAGNVFTTHTPVPAGNDRFPAAMMEKYFKDYVPLLNLSMERFIGLGREDPTDTSEDFCMTVLALRLAAYSNGVSELHGKISRGMWKRIWPSVPESEIPISHITNGVHVHTWLSDEMGRLYERYLGPRWQADITDAKVWQRVDDIPDSELWRSKERLRGRLVSYVRHKLHQQLARAVTSRAKRRAADELLDPESLTIGFARRFATYKRANLILRDPERFRRILLDKDRPVQFVFSGKAHPQDHPGKEIIRQISQLARSDELQHRIVFLEDYNMDIARQLVQGVDVWLNTPRRPLEASGTSGMKAVLNGGLTLSTLDGWWCEAYDGDNGWAIGDGEQPSDREHQDKTESTILYDLLEQEIIPLFYDRGPDGVPREWVARMKNSIRTCGPQFNTHRMLAEYLERFYLPASVHMSLLTKDDYLGARTLASWKKHVRDHWSETSIIATEADTSKELEVGNDLRLTVRVALGPFEPNEISVEVLYGTLDPQEEISANEPLPLSFVSREGSTAIFSGSIPCGEPGQHAFAVRMLPFRSELPNKFDTGKITWWSGNSGGPMEEPPVRCLSGTATH
jgi:starch phosphorylase